MSWNPTQIKKKKKINSSWFWSVKHTESQYVSKDSMWCVHEAVGWNIAVCKLTSFPSVLWKDLRRVKLIIWEVRVVFFPIADTSALWVLGRFDNDSDFSISCDYLGCVSTTIYCPASIQVSPCVSLTGRRVFRVSSQSQRTRRRRGLTSWIVTGLSSCPQSYLQPL